MPFPPLAGSHETEVAVIGCGIAGAAVAFELARRGTAPFVLEAAAPSAGTDVGHVRAGLAEMYAEAVSRFGRAAAREIWESHRDSRRRLEELLPLLRGACGYRSAGGFRLVESRSEAQLLAESEDLLREDGFSGEFFDHHMLEVRFDVRGCAGGYWAADDAELESDELIERLLGAAERAGAAIHSRSPVAALELSSAGAVAVTDAGGRVRAGLAIITAGAGSVGLLPGLADRLAVRPQRRLRLDAGASEWPSPGCARGGRLAWRATPDGLLVRSDGPDDPSHSVSWLAHGGPARELACGGAAVTRDGLPLVGRLPGVPALVAAGFGGAALGLAFEAARWLAEGAAGRDAVPAAWRADRT